MYIHNYLPVIIFLIAASKDSRAVLRKHDFFPIIKWDVI